MDLNIDIHQSSLGLTEAQVQKELAEEETLRVASGGTVLHETSASALLVLGLELEELQRRLKDLVQEKARKGSLPGGSSLTELCTVLRTAIHSWELLRALYVPGLLQFQKEADAFHPATNDFSSRPEEIALWLPSSLPSSHKHTICSPSLLEMEEKLQTAQCHNALDGLRHVLCVKARMVLFKDKNVRGQCDSLRLSAVIDHVHERARGFANRYRLACDAKLKLLGPGSWEAIFQVLHNTDIRSYSDPGRLQKGPGGRLGTTEAGELLSDMAVNGRQGVDLLHKP